MKEAMKYKKNEAKGWVRDNLSGYIAVTTTPMLADGAIDEAGLRHNVDFILSRPGVTGIYLNSLYQEFWTLTAAERRRVSEVTIDAVAQRAHVIVGCNGTSARETTDFAQHAQDHGADLVMVWPPYYGVRTRAGVQAYYEYIAERVDIGMCIYSTTLPELGHYLAADAVADLAAIDNICAVKEVSLALSSYSEIMERCGALLSISSPFEEYHFFGTLAYPDRTPRFLLGSSRPLYMQSEDRPLCANYFNAIVKNDIAGARDALHAILRIANQLHSKYLSMGRHNVALTKHLTSLVGMVAGPVRAPMSDASVNEIADAVVVLEGAGILSPRTQVAEVIA
jgi:4-hydroxy-tetrahydrodipicolinate synthase